MIFQGNVRSCSALGYKLGFVALYLPPEHSNLPPFTTRSTKLPCHRFTRPFSSLSLRLRIAFPLLLATTSTHYNFLFAGPVRFHDGPVADGSTHVLNGAVFDVRFWQSPLSPEQIEERHDQQLPLPGDPPKYPAVWWQFDEVTDGTVPDLSGNERTVQLPRTEQVRL